MPLHFLKRNTRQHLQVFLNFKHFMNKKKVEQGRCQVLGILISTALVPRRLFCKILDICKNLI